MEVWRNLCWYSREFSQVLIKYTIRNMANIFQVNQLLIVGKGIFLVICNTKIKIVNLITTAVWIHSAKKWHWRIKVLILNKGKCWQNYFLSIRVQICWFWSKILRQNQVGFSYLFLWHLKLDWQPTQQNQFWILLLALSSVLIHWLARKIEIFSCFQFTRRLNQFERTL